MQYIGLLTSEQKQNGYFTTGDDDFIWVWYGRNSNPVCIAIFLLEDARVKDIRDVAQRHMERSLWGES